MSISDKVLIFTATDEYLANIIADKLRNESIEVIILNQRSSVYTVHGSIEVYVKPEDEERAKIIIEKDNG